MNTFEKKSIKIAGRYTFWTDTENNYTLHAQDLNSVVETGHGKTNLYRWNPNFDSYLCGKLNSYSIPKEIVECAFNNLFADTYNKRSTTKSTIDNTLIEALKSQAELVERLAIENKKLVEMVIAANTCDIANVTTDIKKEFEVKEIYVELDAVPPEDEITDIPPEDKSIVVSTNKNYPVVDEIVDIDALMALCDDYHKIE